jgi:L-rhamnose-H+ transport protein
MEAVLGVLLVLLGGFSNGSFYMPFKKIRTWSWEVFWIIGGIFSWIIAPWVFSFATVPGLLSIFSEAGMSRMIKPFIFGILWGIGGLTFGLSMRYLGISLGMAIALGLTLVFGALLPSVFVSLFPAVFLDLFPGAASMTDLFSTSSGIITLAGIGLCLIGIVINGKAGLLKDKQVTSQQGPKDRGEFNVRKGISVAIFSGFMSSAFAMGVAAGKPVSAIAKAAGSNPVFENNPTFILIMFGGFLVNAVWCVFLQIKNKTYSDFTRQPVYKNLLLCALGGTVWYLQMFFYGMGESILKGVAGWSLLMASSILFSTMWGLIAGEWRGVERKTMVTLLAGLSVLIISTIVFGYARSL